MVKFAMAGSFGGTSSRSRRLLFYLAVVLAIAAWKFIPRPWHPTVHLRTAQHSIESTATQPQTEEVGRVLDGLYAAYTNRLGSLPGFLRDHPPLQARLFKDRDEFRRINPGLGWAEAYYRKPYCRAYYAGNEINPHHWMVHEATHQLNTEVAGLKLEKWLEEGIADYFGSTLIRSNEFRLGEIDLNTYPAWWLEELAKAPSVEENLRNGSVIPLRAIVTNSGGPSLRSHVNLYYLHWWSLTHFVFEDPRHRTNALALVEGGGKLASFERLIGPIDQVQAEWHAYVREWKASSLTNHRQPVHRCSP